LGGRGGSRRAWHAAPLGALTAAGFLRDYWQKRPLLIRAALPGFESLLTLRELKSLAARDDVESRLVIEKDRATPWRVRHGPLRRADFARLPDSHWSLLVHGVNLHRRDAAGLLARFGFIPNWRVDDLMVSYAPDRGSVGAHVDSYDVFLLQAQGTRRWRIGAGRERDPEFIPDLDLRILRRFRAAREWLLEPGDMLYLPPGIAHHGVAEGECMTYSIGFRAPTVAQLFGDWLDDMPALPQLFSDAGRKPQTHAGEIRGADLRRIAALMRRQLPRGTALADWFGRRVTVLPEPVRARPPARKLSPAQLRARLTGHTTLRRALASRCAYSVTGRTLTLFANGAAYPLATRHVALARTICASETLSRRALRRLRGNRALLRLCAELVNAGAIELVDGQ
jgi:50S ribosomal protein L16 3-hydroxylase